MLRALFGSLCFAWFALFYSTMAVLTWPLSPSGKLYQFWIRAWARTVIALGGVKVTVEGDAHVDPNRTYLVMSNHRSNFDVALLYYALSIPLRGIAKRSLGYIPIFGWGLKLAGFVFVNRSNREEAVESMRRAASTLEKGGNVFLFPEGTRSFDGTLLPFKKGGFVMALEAKVPILPVGVEGTERILRKDSALLWPGNVTLRVGPPIEVAPYVGQPDGKEQLIHKTREVIAGLSGASATALQKT